MIENYQIMCELLEHIEHAKEGDRTLSLTDIILDFAETSPIEMQAIIEAIGEDIYFKELLMNDCISRSMIVTENSTDKLNEW